MAPGAVSPLDAPRARYRPRLPTVIARVFLDALLPLAVAFLVVSFLADPARIDTRELRANSLLMNTSQLFRKESNPFAAAIGSSAILIFVAIAGAIAVGVPAGIAYGWSSSRALKAIAWSAAPSRRRCPPSSGRSRSSS